MFSTTPWIALNALLLLLKSHLKCIELISCLEVLIPFLISLNFRPIIFQIRCEVLKCKQFESHIHSYIVIDAQFLIFVYPYYCGLCGCFFIFFWYFIFKKALCLATNFKLEKMPSRNTDKALNLYLLSK